MAMAFGMGIFGLILYLFILMLPIALLVALQVWLCRKNVKLGLILPGFSLVLSLVIVLSLVTFSQLNSFSGGGNVRVTDENGRVIQEEVVPGGERRDTEIGLRTIAFAGVIFLVTNIPTAVFGGIWLHYKGRRDTLEDLKRMQIEDLG